MFIPEGIINLADLHEIERRLQSLVKDRPALRIILDKMPAKYRKGAQDVQISGIALIGVVGWVYDIIPGISLAARVRERGKRDGAKERLYEEAGRAYIEFAHANNRFFKSGDIDRTEWVRRQREEAKLLATMVYVAGYGEWPTTQRQWGQIGAHTRFQYERIDDFARKIDSMTIEQMNFRSSLYVQGARALFERAVIEGKFNTEFNPAWLPGMPAVLTECRMRCRCYWAITKVKKKDRGYPFYWRCTWTLREANHCNTCVMRRDAWFQLKVYPDGTIFPPVAPIDFLG